MEKRKPKIAKSKVNIYDIPLDMWKYLSKFLQTNDVITLSCVCKQFQQNVQTTMKELDLSYGYSLDFNRLFNYTLSSSCTGINFNHCYWLKPSEILAIISKTSNLEHLHLIECDLNEEFIESVLTNLNLTSMSFTYSLEWRAFLMKLKEEPRDIIIRALRNLKSLEIFNKDFPSGVLIEIYALLLRHCEELEHLKIYECVLRLFELPSAKAPVRFPISARAPTPLPKLKSLVINVQTVREDKNVTNLIALIIRNKVSPLRNVDFGSQNGYFYKRNIQSKLEITFNKSTLSMNGGENFNFWLNYAPAKRSIFQKDYKKIMLNNVELIGFDEFAQLMVLNSGKTLKEFHLKPRYSANDSNLVYWNGLSHIVINCPQITVLDISNHLYDRFQTLGYLSNAAFRNRKSILNDITNLKNLEKLFINANLLYCHYFKSNDKRGEKALPFWKVTSACKNLVEIRIVYNPGMDRCFVHEDSLYPIASCAKLKALHLVRFSIISPTMFSVAKISQNLHGLHIRFVRGVEHQEFLLNKNMKTFSFSGLIELHNKFLQKMRLCTNLEKIYCDAIRLSKLDINTFAEVLRELKNLNAIVVRREVGRRGGRLPEKKSNERLIHVFESLKNERPAFFYTLSSSADMPVAHLDALLHFKIDNCYF